MEEFEKLTPGVRSRIIADSLARANGESSKHSFDDIVSQNRHLAIAARMTSKPQQWEQVSVDENGNVKGTGKIQAYTGIDIAEIFVESVKQNGYAYYPLTGDWRKTGVDQLVLFVKAKDGYVPYARFEIEDIELNTVLSAKHILSLIDATPALACKHKSVLKIFNVQTENLPVSYLGLRSGAELQDSAFKGSAPNVMMI